MITLQDLLIQEDISITIDVKPISNWDDVCSKLYAIQQKRKHFEALEKSLLDEVKSIAENKPKSQDGYKLSKIIRKGSVDMELLTKEYDINLEQFRKADVECWKFEKDIKSERWI
jgi:hypothetical protein